MEDVQKLFDALGEVELHHGESRESAEATREALLERRHELEDEHGVRELEFAFSEHWARRLFVALCRRYELEPYRHKGQPVSVVLVEGPEPFVEDLLWPRFVEYSEMLERHLEHVTTTLIKDILKGDPEQANMVQMRAPLDDD